jgi:hypothetical protein
VVEYGVGVGCGIDWRMCRGGFRVFAKSFQRRHLNAPLKTNSMTDIAALQSFQP